MRSKLAGAGLAALMLITAAGAPVHAEAPAGAAAPQRPTVDIRVCNESGRPASVAVSYVQPGDNQFINRGWYEVAVGACENIVTTDNANFYFYADAMDGSGRSWQGNHTLCVEYPGPYTFYSDGSSECGSHQEVRSFVPVTASEPGVYTWTLDP